ncbi:MAG: ribosome silencing factor [Gammaproteobacteria bacterium GWE2_42_36]|nr:MAG: ribosome silencing factor [Gammaproteobacteria bacterium GWE2_42_36]HCU05537.1 ribosome silencing factor [Coxiellaceae bacterium]
MKNDSGKLKKLIIKILDDLKIEEIVALDVKRLTSITDFMIIGTGRSSRHIQSAAEKLIDEARKQGYRHLTLESENGLGWALVDFNDVIVHLMLPEARRFYALEKLWGTEKK